MLVSCKAKIKDLASLAVPAIITIRIAGIISKFTRKVAGVTSQKKITKTNGIKTMKPKLASADVLPIRLARVRLPLFISVSISLMLLISSTAVAKDPAMKLA
jgi:hypothetical protein